MNREKKYLVIAAILLIIYFITYLILSIFFDTKVVLILVILLLCCLFLLILILYTKIQHNIDKKYIKLNNSNKIIYEGLKSEINKLVNSFSNSDKNLSIFTKELAIFHQKFLTYLEKDNEIIKNIDSKISDNKMNNEKVVEIINSLINNLDLQKQTTLEHEEDMREMLKILDSLLENTKKLNESIKINKSRK